MIRKVTFNNFYSFKENQEINFLAKKKKSYDYFHSKSGDSITKVAGFIGSNASGKTNIMRVFSFLSYFVCESSKDELKSNLHIATKTFFNNKKKSNFSVEFELNNSIFYYEFSIKENIILNEKLFVKKIQKRSRKNEIFSRQLNNITLSDKKIFKSFPRNFLKKIRSDVSLIAYLKAHYNIEIINNVFDYFSGFKTNINERGEINNPRHQFKAVDLYSRNEELKKEMNDFIGLFDLGLESIDIKREAEGAKIEISAKGIHSTEEGNKELDFAYESRGTKLLFFALANIFSALRNNNVVIIDEFEFGFHPEALNKLIGFFIDENKDSRAQIIFSSHSLGFMNKLDMHQIYLVEKDEKCKSFTYRLNQVEGIRSDENFLAKYMTGIYGAFPKIRI